MPGESSPRRLRPLRTAGTRWYRANLKHVMLCTQCVAGTMVESGTGGSIISVTSIEGVRGGPGIRGLRGGESGGDQLHQDRIAGTCPLRNPGELFGPRHHPDRGYGLSGAARARQDFVSPSRWGVPATWTRWRCRRLPGRIAFELRHGSDYPCRRWDPGLEWLVPPS